MKDKEFQLSLRFGLRHWDFSWFSYSTNSTFLCSHCRWRILWM